MKFFTICTLLILVSLGECKSIKKHKQPKSEKRDGGLTAAIVGAAISAGASLAGTTVGALQKSGYSVAVSGSVENYSKWALRFKGCDIEAGYMNVPMRSVSQGKREGFASHKTGNTAKGSWVRCSFTASNTMIHFMYSAPYSFDFHSNWLGFAVCPANDSTCKSLSAKNMYYDSNQYIARKEYYNNVQTLKKCNDVLCISGVMGTNHKPEIDIKVMPKKYDDLTSVAKDASVKDSWTEKDYEDFVENIG